MHDHAPRQAESEATTAEPARRSPSPVGHGAAQMLRLQRTAGNAAVAAMLQPSVQRDVEIDQMEATVESAPPAGAGGSGIEGIRSENGMVTIDGSMVTINAPMVRTTGVLQTDTLIAQSVVGASYTPGAGNVM